MRSLLPLRTANGLALHGTDYERSNLTATYEYYLELFDEIGCKPTRIGLFEPDGAERWIRFGEWEASLRRKGLSASARTRCRPGSRAIRRTAR
jgi:hypothetical protein